MAGFIKITGRFEDLNVSDLKIKKDPKPSKLLINVCLNYKFPV